MKIFAVGPKNPKSRYSQKGDCGAEVMIPLAIAALVAFMILDRLPSSSPAQGFVSNPIHYELFTGGAGKKNQHYCIDVRVDTGEYKNEIARHCRSLFTKSQLEGFKKGQHVEFDLKKRIFTKTLIADNIKTSAQKTDAQKTNTF